MLIKIHLCINHDSDLVFRHVMVETHLLGILINVLINKKEKACQCLTSIPTFLKPGSETRVLSVYSQPIL